MDNPIYGIILGVAGLIIGAFVLFKDEIQILQDVNNLKQTYIEKVNESVDILNTFDLD